METKNAIIESATIGFEHGILTAMLYLDYGGCGQGFGGYVLQISKDSPHYIIDKSCAGHFLTRCLEVGGVESWEELKGKTIRVQAEHTKVHAIGHIIKEDWFCPEEDFKDLE